MPIAIGDRVPQASFRTTTVDGAKTLTSDEVFNGKTVVLFGVPGAFTPTCSNNHLPGYVEKRDAFGARGVDTVAVVAVNDHHVMGAWEKFTGAGGKVLFLADGNADFIRAAGLDMDMSVGGMGVRSKRFSMLVKDGVVAALNIEDSPGKAEASGAERMLEQL
jgi:glutaredoxin/glutathione-dependent peroxiredoxin